MCSIRKKYFLIVMAFWLYSELLKRDSCVLTKARQFLFNNIKNQINHFQIHIMLKNLFVKYRFCRVNSQIYIYLY